MADLMHGLTSKSEHSAQLPLYLATSLIMRQLSVIHVVVFNTARSMIVWAFSLAVSWQTFQGLQ